MTARKSEAGATRAAAFSCCGGGAQRACGGAPRPRRRRRAPPALRTPRGRWPCGLWCDSRGRLCVSPTAGLSLGTPARESAQVQAAPYVIVSQESSTVPCSASGVAVKTSWQKRKAAGGSRREEGNGGFRLTTRRTQREAAPTQTASGMTSYGGGARGAGSHHECHFVNHRRGRKLRFYHGQNDLQVQETSCHVLEVDHPPRRSVGVDPDDPEHDLRQRSKWRRGRRRRGRSWSVSADDGCCGRARSFGAMGERRALGVPRCSRGPGLR